MIRKLLLCLLFAVVPLAMRAADATPTPAPAAYPPYVVDNSELRSLHSKATGRDYLLYIAYPGSYKEHPERKYPVVYVTDGYWSFDKVNTLGGSLWYDKIVPEYILVGIGYVGDKVDYNTERVYELSPSFQDYGWMANFKGRMGGSRAFLDAIKGEIIPYIETNTHADPSFRVLMGSSMGGLFSLFAMYEEPGLFQGVVAASPALSWDHCWLIRRESELRSKAEGPDEKGRLRIPTRLFMSVGGAEWPGFVGYIRAFDEIIKSGNYQDFTYEFRVIEGERHAGNGAEAFNRGLRFVFQPQMPSATIP
jgi:predicted alpha/beta superfamily hydrolase